MELNDLKNFMVVSRLENMQDAADELDSSTSVLSKSLRRLEEDLGTRFFDRVGKFIRLNDAGRALQYKAAPLLAQAKQTQLEFLKLGGLGTTKIKIASPSVLLFRWASVMVRQLQSKIKTTISFDHCFEKLAMDKVIKGEVDLALVTDAMQSQFPNNLLAIKVGELKMQVAAAEHHGLFRRRGRLPKAFSIKDVLKHPFAAPSISPYCGENRGIGCDGWRNDAFPRNIQYVINDYSIISRLVASGQALAYLPDYWINDFSFVPVAIKDCPFECIENVLLIGFDETLMRWAVGTDIE